MRRVRFTLPVSDRPKMGTLSKGTIFDGQKESPLEKVHLLAQCTPTKIVCLGRNYAAHAQELANPIPDRPLCFLKPPSTLIGPEEEMPFLPPPRWTTRPSLPSSSIVAAANVKADDAMEVIRGYTCANGVSDREAQEWEKNWVRAKGI